MNQRLRQTLLTMAAAATALTLGACVNFPYKAPVQQGNLIEARQADALAVGMSKAEVESVLGTPLLPNLFRQDRWDYMYTYKNGPRKTIMKRVTLWFDADGKVAKVDRDLPADAPAKK